MSELYIVGVFKKVQLQIGKMMNCDLTEELQSADAFHYKVTERVRVGEQLLSKRFLVQRTSLNLTCDCKLFKRVGILCCHLLVVFARLDPNALLPPSYITDRWRKDIRQSYGEKVYQADGVLEKDALSRHADIMGRALWIAQEAFISHERYLKAVKCMEWLRSRINIPHAPPIVDEVVAGGTSLRNPDKVTRPGRPPTRRRVSLAERILQRSQKRASQQKRASIEGRANHLCMRSHLDQGIQILTIGT